MQADLALMIAKLTTLRKDDGELVVPVEAQISITRYEAPIYLNGPSKNEPCYYQIYLILPLVIGSKSKKISDMFSVARRVEKLERTDDEWSRTLVAMLQEAPEQRRFINRRLQQARRQQWLLGDTSTRIDGKESIRPSSARPGLMF